MMSKQIWLNNPFLDILPSLDIHGETYDTSLFIINDFINDNLKMGNPKIVIIHGKGKGILRRSVKDVCEKRKDVLKHYIDSTNDGCTVIELEIKE